MTMYVTSIDLDGCLADSRGRYWFFQNEQDKSKINWLEYAMLAGDDPVGPAYNLIRSLSGYNIPLIVCSARYEQSRKVTVNWLLKHKINPQEIILYRSDDSAGILNHGEWKYQQLRNYEQRTGNKVSVHIDDWPETVDYLNTHGIPAVCVRYMNDEKRVLA